MMEDRIEHKMDALPDRLREEFPGLTAIYRFGSFGTERGRAGRIELS